MDTARVFHRSALRAYSPAVMTARSRARHLRAPVVLVDLDGGTGSAVCALDAPDAARIAARCGAEPVAEAVLRVGNERAMRVMILSREGASLWIADGDLTLVAESWAPLRDAADERSTAPMSGTL